jgi:hypothetical protein
LAAPATEGWQFCRTPTCEVGYYASPDVAPITLDAMRTTPFLKSDEPGRLVCFCFEHTARDIIEDARAHPESTIKVAITEACRSGADDCERKNPEGRCCLGNVAAVIRDARAGSPEDSPGDSEDQGACCSSEAPPVVAAGSTVVAALNKLGDRTASKPGD